ncbi:hypothetical protein OPV22_030102 [Ensete ventricosum]|uniref:Uncharacterized protein n=1 Tax=Ensete ventricosum TaxID=4639 RepID=A0AAV8PZB2_ENSVE|nr:hypothetical protein OPV22_030102 [Ensete ventricosum]
MERSLVTACRQKAKGDGGPPTPPTALHSTTTCDGGSFVTVTSTVEGKQCSPIRIHAAKSGEEPSSNPPTFVRLCILSIPGFDHSSSNCEFNKDMNQIVGKEAESYLGKKQKE